MLAIPDGISRRVDCKDGEGAGLAVGKVGAWAANYSRPFTRLASLHAIYRGSGQQDAIVDIDVGVEFGYCERKGVI